jgi:hypothetical protein
MSLLAVGASLLRTLFVGASLLATTSFAATPQAPTGLGPLRIGMSLEELRATTPGVEWTAGRPLKYSQKPTEFTASGVLLAERPFVVKVSSRHHGFYSMELDHAYAAPDADDCEQTARAVFAFVEPQTGPMRPPGAMIRGEEGEAIGAWSTVKLSQVLKEEEFKPISRAKLKGRKPARRWLRATTLESAANHTNPFIELETVSGHAEATFAMDYRRRDNEDTCHIRLVAQRALNPPPLQQLPATALTTAQAPSISRRHFEQSRLTVSVMLPASGVEVNVQCRVERDYGRTRDCRLSELGDGQKTIPGLASSVTPVTLISTPASNAPITNGPPPPPPLTPEALTAKVRSTALRLARAYQFDMARVPNLDRDDPLPVLVDIPIRMAPTDIRELKSTEQAVPVTQAGFRWATRASASQLEQLYPKRALRAAEQTNVALVCEVQEDFSAVCAPTKQDPRPAPDFEWAALEILTYYRAEPTAKDGTTTVGRKILQNLQFRLE